MTAEQTIRQALKKYHIYPDEEINTCQIYKANGRWYIYRSGHFS